MSMVNTRTMAELAAAFRLPWMHDPRFASRCSRRVPHWVAVSSGSSSLVMDCNDAFKTRLAVYKFEGDALAWWKAYKQAKGGDAWVNTLTWAAFKELFFLQFFPRAEQERLKREYHSIRQRANENSTGMEYDRSEQSNKRHKSEVTSISLAHSAGVVIGVTVRIMSVKDPTGRGGWSSGDGEHEPKGTEVSILPDSTSSDSQLSWVPFMSGWSSSADCKKNMGQDSARITHVYRDLPSMFDDKIRSVNALPLDMCEFDMILGIDWRVWMHPSLNVYRSGDGGVALHPSLWR
ncbi:zinc finger, CCHC-type, retrotransposon gag domain protein [Tanacetum coccineum]